MNCQRCSAKVETSKEWRESSTASLTFHACVNGHITAVNNASDELEIERDEFLALVERARSALVG